MVTRTATSNAADIAMLHRDIKKAPFSDAIETVLGANQVG